MKIRKAQRAQCSLNIGITGPSGAGKTLGSLLLAKGLAGDWSKVLLIDTEHGSSHLYAHVGPYNIIQLQPPFAPEQYMEAIEASIQAGMTAIIIDNVSHAWQHLLNCHSRMPGNSFANWAKITPRQTLLVEAILSANAHVICTLRSKQSYVLDLQAGKHKVRKVGLKPIQRDDFNYEMTVIMDLDHEHRCTVSKDRTGIFQSRSNGFMITEETGKLLKKWSEKGVSIEDQIMQSSSVGALSELYQELFPASEQYKVIFTQRKEELEKLKVSSNGVTTNS